VGRRAEYLLQIYLSSFKDDPTIHQLSHSFLQDPRDEKIVVRIECGGRNVMSMHESDKELARVTNDALELFNVGAKSSLVLQ
jgi:hypothetical protein